MPKIIDLTGQQFGEYTVLERDLSKTGGPVYWICKCSCGSQKSVRGQNLRNGTSTHCGCKKS